MAAAGAFGVIGVNRPARDRRDRVLDESGFVQRVGVNRDLDVELVGDGEALIDRGRRRAPVLVQLQAERAGAHLLAQRLGLRSRCPCRESRSSAGNASTASYIRRMFHAPGVQVVALVPVAGPVPPPIIVVMPEWKRVGNLVRRDEVDVRVDRARGEDVPFAGEHFGGRADHESRRDAVHHARIAGLADRRDAAVADADVGLADAGAVDDDGVGDDEVGRARLAGSRAATAPCRRG